MSPGSFRCQWHRLRHAVRRRLLARRIDVLYHQILETWDRQAFTDRFRPYWDPFPGLGAGKFLDLNVWFREALFRYSLIGVDRMGPGLRVLDIGAGTAYFLVVCRHFGHEVLGLDLDDEPLYNECFDFFGLPRVIHRIEPLERLPDSLGRADLITAFMTNFNELPDGSPWGVEPWRFFLDDLCDHLNDRGRFVIKFNQNSRTGEYYCPSVARAIRSHRRFRAKFSMDYACLQAR